MPIRFSAAHLKGRILDAVEKEAKASILAKALEYIPRDTDTAAETGTVVREGSTVSVSFGSSSDRNPKTGQSSNTYIEALEEDMAMRHAPGTGAKFLQRAADEAQGGMAERIARRVKL